ncbi:unnamed protein product [Musa acuminata var. zebrina]
MVRSLSLMSTTGSRIEGHDQNARRWLHYRVIPPNLKPRQMRIPDEKKPRPDEFHHENLPVSISNHPIYDEQMNAEVHLLASEINQAQGRCRLNESLKSSGGLDHMSYESVLSTPRLDHLMDKFDMPTSFSPFHSGERYDVMG